MGQAVRRRSGGPAANSTATGGRTQARIATPREPSTGALAGAAGKEVPLSMAGERALAMAGALGLTGDHTKRHVNAKVSETLFKAAAHRAGTDKVTEILTTALALLAVGDDLGPWLAQNWGSLAHIDPTLADELLAI